MSSISSHKGHHAIEGRSRQAAFTIVELLIVIVVIGILAAITIVAFNGIQNRAQNTSVETELAGVSKKLELYRADAGAGSYPGSEAQLDTADLKFTPSYYREDATLNNAYYCTNDDRSQYVIGVLMKNATKYWLTNGKVEVGSGASLAHAQVCGRIGVMPPDGWQATGYQPAGTPIWRVWTQ